MCGTDDIAGVMKVANILEPCWPKPSTQTKPKRARKFSVHPRLTICGCAMETQVISLTAYKSLGMSFPGGIEPSGYRAVCPRP